MSYSIYCDNKESYTLVEFKPKKDELQCEPIGIHIKTDIVDCIMSLDEWKLPWYDGTDWDTLFGTDLSLASALQIHSGYIK